MAIEFHWIHGDMVPEGTLEVTEAALSLYS